MFVKTGIYAQWRNGGVEMTQKELIIIKTVAEEKSISGAAKKLYIAQPSLSQSVKKIEDSLGTPLFTRTPSGLSLTYAGECYYKTANQILKLYNDLETEVSDINNLKTGRIRLGITNHLGTVLLPPVLSTLFDIAPGLELEVAEDSSTVLEKKLLDGMLDIIVNHAPKYRDNPCINYNLITHDPFVVVMSKDHPIGKKAELIEGCRFPILDVSLLKDESFIFLQKDQRIRQVSDTILENAGICQPKIRLQVRSFGTAQLLAAQGVGVTFIPKQYISIFHVMDEEPAYYFMDEKYGGYWDTSIATLKNSFQSKAEKLLIKIVKEEITKGYY
ncbi:LysR family transcriptional regulator [Clostridium sp. AM58-1XD]|uniref:LysR family transcriptional regulator n=1 Tax=Clostridium sp. AM58-1XD TaxID=2292307 RepID=UPI001FA899F0|nr:LysR family transcriptional regulator [Clostridium sp. AM58-1XD]